MRDMNPDNQQNWKLVCSACAAEFSMSETVDLANGHFQQEHPELESPNFNIMWVGIGPKPKGGMRAGHSRRGAGKSHRRRR